MELYMIIAIILVIYMTYMSIVRIKGIKPQQTEVLHMPTNLNTMDGFAFERFVARLYERLGYKTIVTPESGDFGADVLLFKGDETVCIQCKRYKQPVGITAVQEVIGSLGYYKATRGMVVTNSTYTYAAIQLARANHIELVDGIKLSELIRTSQKVVTIK